MSSIAGKSILVLEDEVLLAIEAADVLKSIGAIVIGPAHRIDQAMRLLDERCPDAALLDVNIHGASSTEVARRLVQQGVPFILTTGYGAQSGVAGAAAVIDKPYTHEQIQQALSSILKPALDPVQPRASELSTQP